MDIKLIYSSIMWKLNLKKKKFLYDVIYFKIDDSIIKLYVLKNCIYFIKEVKLKVECLFMYLIFIILYIYCIILDI